MQTPTPCPCLGTGVYGDPNVSLTICGCPAPRCENCNDHLDSDEEALCLSCRACSTGFPWCFSIERPTAKCSALVVTAVELKEAS
jgi:hypothetical protein